MSLYKDQSNKVHDIDPAFERLLPSGCVPISEEEALLLNPQTVVAPILVASPWQIRKALNLTGMRTAVDAYVATQATQVEKDGWDYATEFREDDAMLVSAAATLGADLHALLALAVTL